MIKKIVNHETRQVTLEYPSYLRRAPFTTSIRSSLDGTTIHAIHTHKMILGELSKFINQRHRAYSVHRAWTPARVRAVDNLRAMLRHQQEGRLLALCVAVRKHRADLTVLRPAFHSPFRKRYDESIQQIIDYCSEEADRRAPYTDCIVN